MIRFRLLGTLDLRDSQDRELRAILRRPKLLALLAYLATARPRGFHRRDALVALLWPELDHVHARTALRQAVHLLREALGPDVLLARGEEELGVSDESLECDVREFETALEAEDAVGALEQYRGALLTGFHISEVPEFERWLDEERERLRRRACEAAERLSDRDLAASNPVGAARWVLRLTELSPFDEVAVRRLIELLDQIGDRAGAVRAYEGFERRLARDLEVAPSAETRRLIAGIRARRETVDVEPTESDRVRVPGEPAVGAYTALRSPRGRPRARLVPTVVVAVLLTAGWLVVARPFAARSAVSAGEPKRIVVLPFVNLCPPEDAYFADGITEEITARLAVIGELRTIGSTSANRYKGTEKTVPEIGKELAVGYVLEGSVRCEKPPQGPARVRVTPQLVSTADGTHLWAEVYDEPLGEIFRVQSDIAQQVAHALDVTLLEPQRRAIETIPTRNLQAYGYYLRGLEYQRGYSPQPGASLEMFEKAVALDPNFALAWALLSRAHSRMYLSHRDRSDARLVQAKRAVDRAFELAPDLPEAHHSLGTYYWLGYLDYDRALREFAVAEAARPNDPQILVARATLRQRQGKLREALADFERTRALDPGSRAAVIGEAQTFMMLRDYPRAEALFERATMLDPEGVEPYHSRVLLSLRLGNIQRARAVLDEARSIGLVDEPYVVQGRLLVELFDRQYEAAITVLATARETFEDQIRFVPKTLSYAQAYGLMQRHDLERAYYDSARVLLVHKVRARPDDPRFRSALGIAYAGLGRKEEAIQEGRKAVELLPVAREAFRGYFFEQELARIYVMVGEYDAALSRLEHLLSIPGWLTPPWLRIDPAWDPLRGDPRFQKIAARGT